MLTRFLWLVGIKAPLLERVVVTRWFGVRFGLRVGLLLGLVLKHLFLLPLVVVILNHGLIVAQQFKLQPLIIVIRLLGFQKYNLVLVILL